MRQLNTDGAPRDAVALDDALGEYGVNLVAVEVYAEGTGVVAIGLEELLLATLAESACPLVVYVYARIAKGDCDIEGVYSPRPRTCLPSMDVESWMSGL